MSSANIIVASDCVHIVSDSVVWNQADGVVQLMVPKVTIMPRFKCAVAFRSTMLAKQYLSLVLSSIDAIGFDDLKSKIIGALRAAVETAGMFAADRFEISVAGVSETRGPSAYRITNLEQPIQTDEKIIPPWTIVEMPKGFWPCPCENSADEAEIRAAIANAPRTLEGHAIAAMETQRAIANRAHKEGREACWVGGFAQLTTVTVEAVTSRIIHRWSDRIGKAIGLTAQQSRTEIAELLWREAGL